MSDDLGKGAADDEYARAAQEIRKQLFGGRKTLGYYIHLAFLAGAAGTIVSKGEWGVLWTIFLIVPEILLLVVAKPFFWNWTERMLRQDAENGNLLRAVRWDYLSLLIDVLLGFAVAAAVSFTVFALAGDALPLPLVWICVAALHTLPFVYSRVGAQYDWGGQVFWDQWAFVTIVVLSVFLPVTLAWGVAVQAAFAGLAVSLCCLHERERIWGKANGYYNNAKNARVLYAELSPTPSQTPEIDRLKNMFAGLEVRWIPMTASALLLVAGLTWALWLRTPSVMVASVLAIFLGYLSAGMFNDPTGMEKEEFARRGIDVDLSARLLDIRAFVMGMSLSVASVVVLWLGGVDVRLLAALSMAAAGACTATVAWRDDGTGGRYDGLSVVVYVISLAAVCALRTAGLAWWECLLPIPAFAYLLPVFRWFFPRSGLRGEERRAAIAAMPGRFSADVRTAAQRALDEKREKRRRRDERRLANLRRSRR